MLTVQAGGPRTTRAQLALRVAALAGREQHGWAGQNACGSLADLELGWLAKACSATKDVACAYCDKHSVGTAQGIVVAVMMSYWPQKQRRAVGC